MTIYVDSNYWMDSRHAERRYVSRTMRAAIRERTLLNFTSLLEVAHYFIGLGEAEFMSRMARLRNLTALNLSDLFKALGYLRSLDFLNKKGHMSRFCLAHSLWF